VLLGYGRGSELSSGLRSSDGCTKDGHGDDRLLKPFPDLLGRAAKSQHRRANIGSCAGQFR